MVRAATILDEQAVYEINCELVEMALDPQQFHEAYLDYLNNPKMHTLLFEEDGQVIALLTLRIGTMLCQAGTIAEIMELFTREGMRSRGAGHQLYLEARRIAKEAGCIRLEVSCSKKRVDAHRFYEREGMEFTRLRFTVDL